MKLVSLEEYEGRVVLRLELEESGVEEKRRDNGIGIGLEIQSRKVQK